VFETTEQIGVAVGELTDAVWTLSAMASVLSSGFEAPLSVDDPGPGDEAPAAGDVIREHLANHRRNGPEVRAVCGCREDGVRHTTVSIGGLNVHVHVRCCHAGSICSSPQFEPS
jgi:hypothetical protein